MSKAKSRIVRRGVGRHPSLAGRPNKVESLQRERDEALAQLTATSEVLKVISSSFVDAQPVFDAIVKSCSGLFPDAAVAIALPGKDLIKAVALAENDSIQSYKWRQRFPIPLSREYMHGISILDRRIIDIPDGRDASPEFAIGSSNFLTTGYSAITIVSMLKENAAIGALSIVRFAPGPLTDRQMNLLKNFAARAVIAIENSRLLNEPRQRTDDLSRSLDDLRTAQDRLVQTEKLASLGQLTAGIAHEIKNPLNFVNNFSVQSAELIDDMKDVLSDISVERNKRKELDEISQMLKANLKKVVQHGKRADSIVKNMLLHSREGSGEHRSVDINAIVEESLNLAYHGAWAEKAGFDITMQRNFDSAAGIADVYPQEITRALLNLISNGFYAVARRATEAGDDFKSVLSAATRMPRRQYRNSHPRQRHRYPSRSKRQNIQPVLHDQTIGRRYRAWAVDESRHHRETARRQHRCRDGARTFHRVQDCIASEEPKVTGETHFTG